MDVTGAPELTLADVTVARTCTMPEKVQLCGREWCPKTDPPAPCASNPEARLKYLKYPYKHEQLHVVVAELAQWKLSAAE